MRKTAITLLLLTTLALAQPWLYPEERVPVPLTETTEHELSFTEIFSVDYDIVEGTTGGTGSFLLINWPYAYISCSVWGLMVWDVSIPSSPTMLSHTYGYSTEPDLYLGLGAFDIYQDTLLVGTLGREGSAGLMIVNVANPYDPEVISTYEIFGYDYQTVVHDGFAYQPRADYYYPGLNGLLSYDISDPVHPVFADSIRTPGALSTWIAIEGNYAYLIDLYSAHDGFDILDLSDPLDLEYVDFIPFSSVKINFSFGGYLYVIGDHGSSVFDISDPLDPIEIGSFPGISCFKLTFDWPYIYCPTGAGVAMVDISIPESTFVAGWLPLSQAWNATGVSDSNLLFVSTYDELKIFRWENTGIEEEPPKPDDYSISAYPNPFNSAVTISIDIPVGDGSPVPFDVEIYDVNGRMVADTRTIRSLSGAETTLPRNSLRLRSGSVFAPLHKGGQGGSYIWRPAPSLPSGVYLVRATIPQQAAGAVCTKRVVYLK